MSFLEKLKGKFSNFEVKLSAKKEFFFLAIVSFYLVFDSMVTAINSYSWRIGTTPGAWLSVSAMVMLYMLPIILLSFFILTQFKKGSKWTVYPLILLYLLMTRDNLFVWMFSQFRNTTFLYVINLMIGSVIFLYVLLQSLSLLNKKIENVNSGESKMLYWILLDSAVIFYLLYGFSFPFILTILAMLFYYTKNYFISYSTLIFITFYRLVIWINTIIPPGKLTYTFISSLQFFVPIFMLFLIVLFFYKEKQLEYIKDTSNEIFGAVKMAKEKAKDTIEKARKEKESKVQDEVKEENIEDEVFEEDLPVEENKEKVENKENLPKDKNIFDQYKNISYKKIMFFLSKIIYKITFYIINK